MYDSFNPNIDIQNRSSVCILEMPEVRKAESLPKCPKNCSQLQFYQRDFYLFPWCC